MKVEKNMRVSPAQESSKVAQEHPLSRNIDARHHRLAWILTGLVLFGISFGFVEAVVVVNLRFILDPLSRRVGGIAAEGALPMIALEQLERTNPAALRLMRIEMLREASTLILLAGVGLAAGRNFIQRFSAF